MVEMSANDVLLPLEASKEDCGQLSREELAMFDLVWSDRPDVSETSDLLSAGAGCSGSGGGSGEGSGEEIDLLGVDDDDESFQGDVTDLPPTFKKKRSEDAFSPGIGGDFDAQSPSVIGSVVSLGDRTGIVSMGLSKLHHPSPRSALAASVTGQQGASLLDDPSMDIVSSLDIPASAQKLSLGIGHDRLMRAAAQLPETPRFPGRSAVDDADNMELLDSVTCTICQEPIAWAGDVDPICLSKVDLNPNESARSVYEELAPVLLMGCLLHQSCVRNSCKNKLIVSASRIDATELSDEQVQSANGPIAKAFAENPFTVVSDFSKAMRLKPIAVSRDSSHHKTQTGSHKRNASVDDADSSQRTSKRSKQSTRRDLLEDINMEVVDLEVDEMRTPVAGTIVREMNMSPQVSPSGNVSSNTVDPLPVVHASDEVGLVGSPGLLLTDALYAGVVGGELTDPSGIPTPSATKYLQRDLLAKEPKWKLNTAVIKQLPAWMQPTGPNDVLGLLPYGMQMKTGHLKSSVHATPSEKSSTVKQQQDPMPNLPQMQPVLRVTRAGDLENICSALPIGDFHSFSISHGPESNEWAAIVGIEEQEKLAKLVGDLGTWNPDIGYCIRNGIPVVVGTQHAHDAICFGPGTVQWSFALGTRHRARLDFAFCEITLSKLQKFVTKCDANSQVTRQGPVRSFNVPVVSLILEMLHREVSQELSHGGCLELNAIELSSQTHARHLAIRKQDKLVRTHELTTHRLAPIVPLPRNKPAPIPEKRSKADNRLARSPFIAPVPALSLVNGSNKLFTALSGPEDDVNAAKLAIPSLLIPSQTRTYPVVKLDVLKLIVERAYTELKHERGVRSILRTLDCEIVREPKNSIVTHCESPSCGKELIHHYFFCNGCNTSDFFFEGRSGKSSVGGIGAQRISTKSKKYSHTKRSVSRSGKSGIKKQTEGSGTSSRKSREPMPAWLSIGNRVTVADSRRQGIVIASGHGFFTIQIENGGTVLKRRKGLLPPTDGAGAAPVNTSTRLTNPVAADATVATAQTAAENKMSVTTSVKLEVSSSLGDSPTSNRTVSTERTARVGSTSSKRPGSCLDKNRLSREKYGVSNHGKPAGEGWKTSAEKVSDVVAAGQNGNDEWSKSTVESDLSRNHPAMFCFDCWLQHLHTTPDHASQIMCVERVSFDKLEQLVDFGNQLVAIREQQEKHVCEKQQSDSTTQTCGCHPTGVSSTTTELDNSVAIDTHSDKKISVKQLDVNTQRAFEIKEEASQCEEYNSSPQDDRIYRIDESPTSRYYNHVDAPCAPGNDYQQLVSYRFDQPTSAQALASTVSPKSREEIIAALVHPGKKQAVFPALPGGVSPFVSLTQPADNMPVKKKASNSTGGEEKSGCKVSATTSSNTSRNGVEKQSTNPTSKTEERNLNTSEKEQVKNGESKTESTSAKSDKSEKNDETAGGGEWSSCFLDRGSFCTFEASLNLESESFINFPVTSQVYY